MKRSTEDFWVDAAVGALVCALDLACFLAIYVIVHGFIGVHNPIAVGMAVVAALSRPWRGAKP